MRSEDRYARRRVQDGVRVRLRVFIFCDETASSFFCLLDSLASDLCTPTSVLLHFSLPSEAVLRGHEVAGLPSSLCFSLTSDC